MTTSLLASYKCNGTGRDTYIANDDETRHGKSEPLITPRWRHWVKPPGCERQSKQPPPLGIREGKPVGYSGHVRGRRTAVAQSFGALTSRQARQPKPPTGAKQHSLMRAGIDQTWVVTSKDYGAEQEFPTKHSGSISAREPRERPHGSNHYPCNQLPRISAMHSPGRGPATSRTLKSTTNTEMATLTPQSDPNMPCWCDQKSGYAGYKPRFPTRTKRTAFPEDTRQ